jgi:hypothetical protein
VYDDHIGNYAIDFVSNKSTILAADQVIIWRLETAEGYTAIGKITGITGKR